LWNYCCRPTLPDKGLWDDEHLTMLNYFDDPRRMKNAWPWRNPTALQVIDSVSHSLGQEP
jgi:hypothetical protein